jgi:hypothetical protein
MDDLIYRRNSILINSRRTSAPILSPSNRKVSSEMTDVKPQNLQDASKTKHPSKGLPENQKKTLYIKSQESKSEISHLSACVPYVYTYTLPLSFS